MKTTLNFLRLRYKNFLSTGNLFTEIDFASVPMTLIVGNNGDGKSTMIDALCFALFKKPFRKINLPQLVNSVTKKELLVEVEFTARGNHYKIVRGIKPAIFEIWKNDVLINQDATVDYQAELEKRILRTNLKTFSQIVILGSANYTPFMQMRPHERRPIVEDIYDLSIITKMNSVLNSRLARAEKELNALENARDLLLQKLELSQKHQDLQSEDKQKWIEQKSAAVFEIEKKIASLSTQQHNIIEANLLLEPELKEYAAYNKKLRDMSDIRAGILQNVSSIEREIHWLDNHDDCPTCKQAIATEFRAAAFAQKTSRLTEVKDGLSKLDAMIKEASDRQYELQQVDSEHSENKTKIFVLSKEIQTCISTVNTLNKEIAQLQAEHEEVVDEASITEIESDIVEKKREWGRMVAEREMMNQLSVYCKDTGVKARIIKKYAGKFNELTNAYLAKLDFFVDFHLDESFEETIKSRGRDGFSYNSFSEGEKLRIDLAVLFAWRDIAKVRASLNTNLLIMDEIFDGSLDTQGVEELLKIMRKVTTDNNVFVISHQTDRLEQHFDRKLSFRKTKGFSQLEAA